MTFLDNTLLYLLAKADGETSEEKIANFTFISFLSGMSSLLFAFFSFLYGAVTNDFFKQGRAFQFFIIFFALGIFLTILNFLLDKYLKKLVEKHTVIERSKAKSKEIYKPTSEVELSIRALGKEKSISTKETFSNEELNNIKDGCVIIKASKKGEEKTIYAEEVEISLTNKDETAALNVPEEALIYKIEGVSLTKETEQKICGFIKEKETTIFRTKLFLSASVDEELLEKLKNKQELDDLLAL
jgi:lipopolysaccharide export LptBFGC system permease protein LptF